MSAGVAVILSDQTPWNDLEENDVGYNFTLENDQHYIKAIEQYAAMDKCQMQSVADKVLTYAVENSNDKVKSTGYRKIFELG